MSLLKDVLGSGIDVDSRVENGQFLCVFLELSDICAKQFLPFFGLTHDRKEILDSVDFGIFLLLRFGNMRET